MANVDHLLPRVGERVERYELLHELARGGFGVVFRARQVGLNADVAIKFLAPLDLSQVKEQQILERFWQEAQVAQELQHPCAIKVRDYGQTPSGLLFMVTEFIDGRELTDVIREQPLSVARTARVVGQVLGCLSEAHGRGIVHRDLKPGNIMLRDIFGEKDVVTVLDFGIAKVAQSRGGVKTKTGTALGTPYYAAPEQCRGEKQLDGRADLYALGLIMAECLTGRRVIETNNQMAAIYAHTGPQPHLFETLVQQSPLFPVIQRATQKETGARFADAMRMREALEQAATRAPQAGVPVATTPVQSSAVHEALNRGGWPQTPGPAQWSNEHVPPQAPPSSPSFAGPVGAPNGTRPPPGGAVAAPPPMMMSGSGPVPEKKGSNLLWVLATFLLVATAGVAILLFTGQKEPAPAEEPRPEAGSEAATETEAANRAHDPRTALEAPPTNGQPAARGPVRTTVYYVTENGDLRVVTLQGCGFESGLRVGQSAPVGATGFDIEITRLRDESSCIGQTSASASQLSAVSEIVFRGRDGR